MSAIRENRATAWYNGYWETRDTMVNLDDIHLEYVTDNAGAKRAVILPIEVFYQLLEDLEDLAVAAERADEPTIPHQTLIAQLKSDGLLPD